MNEKTFTILSTQSPAVFAPHAHHEVSSKYTFIHTLDLVNAIEAEGWNLTSAQQQVVRKKDREGFQTHLLRFSHPDVGSADFRPELIALNAHDRSSSLQLHAGVFRMACANKIIIADTLLEAMRLRHVGLELTDVLEAVVEMQKKLEMLPDVVDAWKSTQVDEPTANAIALHGARARWKDGSPVCPNIFHRYTRRSEDQHRDLWTVFNRIQENLISGMTWRRTWGSPRILGTDANGRRIFTIRKVKGVAETTRINKALWDLGQRACDGTLSEVFLPPTPVWVHQDW